MQYTIVRNICEPPDTYDKVVLLNKVVTKFTLTVLAMSVCIVDVSEASGCLTCVMQYDF